MTHFERIHAVSFDAGLDLVDTINQTHRVHDILGNAGREQIAVVLMPQPNWLGMPPRPPTIVYLPSPGLTLGVLNGLRAAWGFDPVHTCAPQWRPRPPGPQPLTPLTATWRFAQYGCSWSLIFMAALFAGHELLVPATSADSQALQVHVGRNARGELCALVCPLGQGRSHSGHVLWRGCGPSFIARQLEQLMWGRPLALRAPSNQPPSRRVA
jgi:hypothetical protein